MATAKLGDLQQLHCRIGSSEKRKLLEEQRTALHCRVGASELGSTLRGRIPRAIERCVPFACRVALVGAATDDQCGYLDLLAA